MDILNEVEVLFKKLDAVHGDLKEEAVRKIVEKLSSDGKKSKDLSVSRKRTIRRKKSTLSKEPNVVDDIEYQNSGEFQVEDVVTSRGRKAKRICCNLLKQTSASDIDSEKEIEGSHNLPEQLGIDGCVDSSHLNKRYIETKDCTKLTNKLILNEKCSQSCNTTASSDSVETELTNAFEDKDDAMDCNIKHESELYGDPKIDTLEEFQLVIVDQDGGGSEAEGYNRTDQKTATNEQKKRKSSEKVKITGGSRKALPKRGDRVIDSSPKILSCDNCTFQTQKKAILRNHIIRKHDGLRPYKCQDCGKAFPQMSGLKIHLKRHRGQRDYPCDYGCNYRAYTQGDKIRHMTLHTGERNHQCQYCGKAFAKDSTLREHVKSVHERPNKHICPTCGFATYRANNLRVHISMRHRGEYNNHVCPVCGAKVKQRAAFLDHMRSHTGERPHKCPLCESSFTCLARLTVHRKAVHGPREFTCEHCQKTFQTKHNMLRHQLTHTNEKPYACPYCQYSCNTQGNVTKHVKGVHNKPDFSYRKYKAEQQEEFDYTAVKTEWVEKGEKLTQEYLQELSKKLGREVTLSQLKEQEAEKAKQIIEEMEQVKKRRPRKQENDSCKREHDYHSKLAPEETESVEETDEPTAVLLTVTQTSGSTPPNNSLENGILSQTPVIHGVAMNNSPSNQPTLFIQTPQDDEINRLQPVIESVESRNNHEPPIQNIQFCVNERASLDDQIPLQVIYHSPSSRNSSQGNVTSDFHNSKYMNNINYVEVKGDATASQTVVVIINTDNQCRE